MERTQALADLLEILGNEMYLLWAQMDAYQQLFLVEQTRRAPLLAETAPGFFFIVQIALIESILIRAFRLMDPADTYGAPNVSFPGLQGALESASGKECDSIEKLKADLSALRADWGSSGDTGTGTGTAARTNYVRLKQLRNKVLAHNDLKKRREHPTNQLCAEITPGDYRLMRELASRMWRLYLRANECQSDVGAISMAHGGPEDEPIVVLKHLATARCLDLLIGEEIEAKISAFVASRVGTEVGDDPFDEAWE